MTQRGTGTWFSAFLQLPPPPIATFAEGSARQSRSTVKRDLPCAPNSKDATAAADGQGTAPEEPWSLAGATGLPVPPRPWQRGFGCCPVGVHMADWAWPSTSLGRNECDLSQAALHRAPALCMRGWRVGIPEVGSHPRMLSRHSNPRRARSDRAHMEDGYGSLICPTNVSSTILRNSLRPAGGNGHIPFGGNGANTN
eukprot:gene16393-biopygen23268